MDREILDSMARTLWVNAWADWMEEQGESLRGELFSQAPKTPREAVKAAQSLAKKIESMNGMDMGELWEKASTAEGRHSSRPDKEDFGYGLAMRSLGHGVAWEDDHPDIGIKYPLVEFGPWDVDERAFTASTKGVADRKMIAVELLRVARLLTSAGRLTLNVTYNTITPESAEIGDFEDTGFEERGLKFDDLHEMVDYILDEGAIEPSSSGRYGRGDWFSTEYYVEDYGTGEERQLNFHPEGITDEEGQIIADSVKKGRNLAPEEE